jgi:hypothetical protein
MVALPPFWQANESKVISILDSFGIQFDSKSFQRHSFPALEGKYRSESYELSISRDYSDDLLFGYRGVNRLLLELSNQDGRPMLFLI